MSQGLGPVTQLNAARRATARDQALSWDIQTIQFWFESTKDAQEIIHRCHDGNAAAYPSGWKLSDVSQRSRRSREWLATFDVSVPATPGDGAFVRSILNLIK